MDNTVLITAVVVVLVLVILYFSFVRGERLVNLRGRLIIMFRPRMIVDGGTVPNVAKMIEPEPGIIYRTNYVPSDTHFTLVMFGEERNWVVTNITYLGYISGELDVWNGNHISEYLPPKPGVYTFVLYQQKGLNIAKKFDDRDRTMFDLDEFASEYSLYELVRAKIAVV